MKHITQVSVVIVGYKAYKAIQKLIESLNDPVIGEIIVVDNSFKNRGFGAGSNLGARRAHYPFVLFLNPDCVVEDDAVSKLVEIHEYVKDAGVMGPALLDRNGKAYLSTTGQPSAASAWQVFSFINRWFPKRKVSRDFWQRQKPPKEIQKVGTVSGAAMLMNKDYFLKVGGFDERMFMYWEDYDLCRRVLLDKKFVYFVPQAKVFHERAVSSGYQQRSKLERWFVQSRFIFLTKYLGFKGFLTQMFLSVTENWPLILIVGLAVVFRFWGMPERMVFFPDIGYDMLAAQESLKQKTLPLLGIPSSVPYFLQGPLYVWLLMGIFWLFGFRPEIVGLVAALLGVIGVVALYVTVQIFWNRRVALVAGVLAAVMPFMVVHGRMPFMTNPIPLMSVLFLASLSVRPRKGIHFFWVGASWALLYQFELAHFPLVLLVGAYAWFNRRVTLTLGKRLAWALAGIGMGLLPQIIFDLTHGFKQLGLFGAWVGYRIGLFVAGGSGLVERLAGFWDKVSFYVPRFFGYSNPFWFLLWTILAFLGWALVKKRREVPALVNYSWASLGVLGAGYFVHGSPSEAYFPGLVVPFLLVIVYGLMELFKRRYYVLALLLLLYVGSSFYTLLKYDYYLSTPTSAALGLESHYGAAYETYIQLALWVQSHIGSEQVRLSVRGPSEVPESFSDNFEVALERVGVKVGEEAVHTVILFSGTPSSRDYEELVVYKVEGVSIGLERRNR
jgi:GT2 family glycosyltransferase/4-amino-4-deoxy-L-arabinose transferase-like glycosyltransferase